MRGVTFTNGDTARRTAVDWSLVMTSKIIGTPETKIKTVDLPDRDGVLDYTSALRGVPAYNTRTLTFTFEYLETSDWETVFTEIKNLLHGQRVRIDDPDDVNYYYMGRATVSDPTSGIIKRITVTVMADTWRYRVGLPTAISATVTSGATVVLPNDYRPVVPTVTATAAVNFSFGGVNYAISGAGTFKFPRMVLTHGANVVTLTSGTGTITFTYQEGAL